MTTVEWKQRAIEGFPVGTLVREKETGRVGTVVMRPPPKYVRVRFDGDDVDTNGHPCAPEELDVLERATDDERASRFYEEEWDTCQPTRTLAALKRLIAEARSERCGEAVSFVPLADVQKLLTFGMPRMRQELERLLTRSASRPSEDSPRCGHWRDVAGGKLRCHLNGEHSGPCQNGPKRWLAGNPGSAIWEERATGDDQPGGGALRNLPVVYRLTTLQAEAASMLDAYGPLTAGDPDSVGVLAGILGARREQCAQELYDLARWCRDHGYEARARHTESAARRLQGVATEDT